MTFSTIETMVAALAATKPTFDYIPPKENPEQDTKPLNAMVDSYWDRDQWNIKVQSWIRSSLIYGTGVVYLYWDMDHPVMVNLPLRDFWFDPDASSIEGCASSFYAGRRYLTTLEELKSYEVVDPDTGEMKPKFMNLDKVELGAGGNTGEETDKQQKDLWYGSTASKPEDTQVEVLEMWSDDRIKSVVNRTQLIQDDENPYKTRHRDRLEMQYQQQEMGDAAADPEAVQQALSKAKERADNEAHGIIPFAVQRNYVDESLFYGRGEVEIIGDLQEWLNDLTNQNADSLSFTLSPEDLLDPSVWDKHEQVQHAPGAVLPFRPDQLQPYARQPLPTEAFTERLNIKTEIRETTAVSEATKGVTSETQQTATEVQAQMAQAGQRIGMKVTQIENEGFHRLARIVFEMIQLYVTETTPVRVSDKDGTHAEDFNPADFMGDYQPMVQLQNTVQAKQKEEMTAAKEVFASLMMDPMINKPELYKLVLPKAFGLDPDEVNKLLQPDPAMAMGGMPPMPGAPAPGGAMPPGMPMPPAPTPDMGAMA